LPRLPLLHGVDSTHHRNPSVPAICVMRSRLGARSAPEAGFAPLGKAVPHSLHSGLVVLPCAVRLEAAKRHQVSQGSSSVTAPFYVMPASGIEPDLRRAAYALVDSGVRGTNGRHKGRGKQESVWILREQGMTYQEIASRLELSIPGVRSALTRIQGKIARIQAIRWGSPEFPLWE
jgi:hypothetical protein